MRVAGTSDTHRACIRQVTDKLCDSTLSHACVMNMNVCLLLDGDTGEYLTRC